MNKYQEALEKLRKIEQTENTWDENCEVLQKLVDKATPKKPKEQLIDNYCRGIPGGTPNEKELNYFCSNCNELVGDEWFKYNFCPNCGQALDWSEE